MLLWKSHWNRQKNVFSVKSSETVAQCVMMLYWFLMQNWCLVVVVRNLQLCTVSLAPVFLTERYIWTANCGRDCTFDFLKRRRLELRINHINYKIAGQKVSNTWSKASGMKFILKKSIDTLLVVWQMLLAACTSKNFPVEDIWKTELKKKGETM